MSVLVLVLVSLLCHVAVFSVTPTSIPGAVQPATGDSGGEPGSTLTAYQFGALVDAGMRSGRGPRLSCGLDSHVH